jgi:hypothetical protein
MSEETHQAVSRVNQLYWGFVISRAVHVAAKLGIADHVTETGVTVSEIAKKLNVNEDRLYRLMRLLASYEMFSEKEKYKYYPTSLSKVIETEGDASIRSAAHLVTSSMWQAFGQLEHSVDTGKDSYSEIFGKGVFDYLHEHPDEAQEFDEAMDNYAQFENPVLSEALPMNGADLIVDVGGGHGDFLRHVLMQNKEMNGVLFDQPFVINQAHKYDEEESSNRTSKVGGSFFESVPAHADVYVLKRILHDWKDEDCIRILQTCRNSMKDDSRLFVIDAIVPEGNGSHFSKDLEVFLMTWGGNERDKFEFENLAAQANLEIVSVHEPATLLSIIEMKKK